jgi:hypothetical protein
VQAPDSFGPIFGARCEKHRLANVDYRTSALQAINSLRNLHIEMKMLREVPLCHRDWELTEIHKAPGEPVTTVISHPNRDH